MNIEDVLGLMQERVIDEYTDTSLVEEQLLCEINSDWINKYKCNTNNWAIRKHLIQYLGQLILADIRVLSLVGVNGIGKSSLALNVGCSSPLCDILPTLKIISFDTYKANFDVFAKQILGNQIIIDGEIPPSILIQKMFF